MEGVYMKKPKRVYMEKKLTLLEKKHNNSRNLLNFLRLEYVLLFFFFFISTCDYRIGYDTMIQ